MSIDKIVCVGKNYLDHAMELGDPIPEKPVLFLKPASVVKQASHWGDELTLYFPQDEASVQPECEIALRIARDGFKMTREEAKSAISDVTLGLDMTLRTRQSHLKKQGHPWTTSKVFPDAAVLGPWISYERFPEYLNTEFQLDINDVRKQYAKGADMMMKPVDLLMYISQFFPLKAGDIIYTGTPAGVTSISEQTTAEIRWNDLFYRVSWELY